MIFLRQDQIWVSIDLYGGGWGGGEVEISFFIPPAYEVCNGGI